MAIGRQQEWLRPFLFGIFGKMGCGRIIHICHKNEIGRYFRISEQESVYRHVTRRQYRKCLKYSLRRRAIIVHTILIKDLTESGTVRSLLGKYGAPDYYSRITLGSQEFWGRTIQGTREVTDPWFEIYFTDQDRVPITIAVWDEDDPDSKKDTEIDINPVMGAKELSFFCDTNSGAIDRRHLRHS